MVLDYAKKMNPDMSDEDAILAYLNSRSAEMETEVTNKLFGVKNSTGGYLRAGYETLRKFYEGDQWQYNRELGSAMTVTNFCRMTVNNYTAFLTQEEPDIDIPPLDMNDEVEVYRVKFVEDIIKDILDENQFYNVFYEGAQNGSLLGDTIIVGPFYDDDKERIWFRNVKRPEYVRILWETEDYDRIMGFMYEYYMTPEIAQSKWGDILKEKNIKIQTETTAERITLTRKSNIDLQPKVKIREFWDDEVRVLYLNDHTLKYEKHGYGFVPMVYIRNIPHPTEPGGISDIEDLLDPQVAYNEQNSDMQDIIKQVAFASIFGKNLDSVEEIQSGVAKIYNLGDEAEVFNDPRNTNFPFLQAYLGDKKTDIDVASGMPDVFQGGKGSRDVSGRALSVLMTPINNRIRGKEKRWTIGLKQLVRNIEILIEKFTPGGSQLIQKHYKVDVFFPGTLIRDVTEELNKFLQKVQSQSTTMKNIGIASPKDEQELMKKELADDRLVPEISRAPQLQMQITQQLVAKAQQNVQEQQGQGGAQTPGGPILSEGQNQPGDQPASTRGNPTPTGATPEGALAQSAGNQSGVPIIPNL